MSTQDDIDFENPPAGSEMLEPHDYLLDVLPGILSEGPVLIEFKHDGGISSVKSAMIVTLHPDECPLDLLPPLPEDHYAIWAWNIRSNEWCQIDCREVEDAQTWPPTEVQEPRIINDDA